MLFVTSAVVAVDAHHFARANPEAGLHVLVQVAALGLLQRCLRRGNTEVPLDVPECHRDSRDYRQVSWAQSKHQLLRLVTSTTRKALCLSSRFKSSRCRRSARARSAAVGVWRAYPSVHPSSAPNTAANHRTLASNTDGSVDVVAAAAPCVPVLTTSGGTVAAADFFVLVVVAAKEHDVAHIIGAVVGGGRDAETLDLHHKHATGVSHLAPQTPGHGDIERCNMAGCSERHGWPHPNAVQVAEVVHLENTSRLAVLGRAGHTHLVGGSSTHVSENGGVVG